MDLPASLLCGLCVHAATSRFRCPGCVITVTKKQISQTVYTVQVRHIPGRPIPPTVSQLWGWSEDQYWQDEQSFPESEKSEAQDYLDALRSSRLASSYESRVVRRHVVEKVLSW